jgi:hypothetical protein
VSALRGLADFGVLSNMACAGAQMMSLSHKAIMRLLLNNQVATSSLVAAYCMEDGRVNLDGVARMAQVPVLQCLRDTGEALLALPPQRHCRVTLM